MRSRIRPLVALLTLLTLSLTLAEGVWASTCMQGMEMGGAAMAMSHVGSEGMSAAMGHTGHAGGRGTESGSPETPHCPFAPVPGSCLAHAASLPAHAPESLVASPEGTSAVVAPAPAPSLLLVSSFFRPPRV